jgi:selenide,water dikinase
LSVNGLVHPDRILRNSDARPDDRLILTKPLGTGVIINGNNAGKTLPDNLEPVIESMITLNRVAAELLTEFTVHACTDVTGFGLAGHAGKMAATSGVTMRIDFESLPFFAQAQELYYDKIGTGANKPNFEKVAEELEFGRKLSWKDQQLLYDPQTSGGLLIAVADYEAEQLLKRLLEQGVKHACLIGEVTEYDGKGLRII